MRAGTETQTVRRFARLNPACVVCGATNPIGLRLSFSSMAQCVVAAWRPGDEWQSFEGVIHGGIVSSVLDEAMSQALIALGWEAFTAELRVRFRRQVTPGDSLAVTGWVTQRQKRRILAEAALKDAGGLERAHAWATFLAVRG